ncbi:Toxoplasma gondii family A protein [Toxoplasma gondii ME49]|uniref:Toxoplasma gondii family A protein n=2 Tax=Toxoplasma gondii TaxID=5811 RepID=S8ESU0_TOXGM|nr:Toxoplasma gondii family A protein [Toxoplasma gondii ME49]EPT25322.1 Toxoplasma gondii family A protein [Toxoplasma gondii ME49]KFH09302.1 Toxoplasma gondii family A protein [Toxoplasma gondii VAND]|eukprot:XP_002370544.1 Toxoplasma gondii family A protein [Toxoplasma gondii ME49]
MEGRILQVTCLTLMMGTVLSCMGVESIKPTTEFNFTTTIPKAGLEKNVELVFLLGPSNTLQVIDETSSAVYLPRESASTEEPPSEPYGAAYRYENGACDFAKTIEFKDEFPGYKTPLWVQEQIASEESERESAGKVVKYVFTNPPAEYLGGRLSFCVRFKTMLAPGSNTETSTSPPTPSVPSGGAKPDGTTNPENEDGGSNPVKPGLPSPETGLQPDLESSPVTPPPKPADPPASSGHGSHTDDQMAGAEDGKGDSLGDEGEEENSALGSTSSASSISHANSQPPSSRPTVDQTGENNEDGLARSAVHHKPIQEETPATIQGDAAAAGFETTDQHLEHGVSREGGARMRRLTEKPAATEAFLTIVVHSAAWRVTGGMGLLPVSLLTVATALFLVW